jgi:Fe-S-cluster-containing dehydrogenase component
MNTTSITEKAQARYGMVIDLDRCTGCGACMVACAVENNVAPAGAKASERTGITWMRVYRMNNGEPFPDSRTVYVPMTCQQCDHHTPCVSVCPQNAVEVDPATGIVGQIPVRCLGCRYCMAACPYHARYFNWADPEWPVGTEESLNPDVSVRMRGVVEKCNFCHHRLHAAQERAAAEGRKEIHEKEYQPACVEACPTEAITFGNLAVEESNAARLAHSPETFRFLERLGTEPKIYYHSSEEWVRNRAAREVPKPGEGRTHG